MEPYSDDDDQPLPYDDEALDNISSSATSAPAARSNPSITLRQPSWPQQTKKAPSYLAAPPKGSTVDTGDLLGDLTASVADMTVALGLLRADVKQNANSAFVMSAAVPGISTRLARLEDSVTLLTTVVEDLRAMMLTLIDRGVQH